MSVLLDEWNRFVKAPRRNPPLSGDELTQFIKELAQKGKLKNYSEEEWGKILAKYAMTPEEIGQFMEQVAAYLPQGDVDPENEEPMRF